MRYRAATREGAGILRRKGAMLDRVQRPLSLFIFGG